MTQQSFTAKLLRVTLITGSNQTFQNTGDNTLALTGLRMRAVITAVARLATTLDLSIYGMLPADMNALTILFFKTAVLDQSVIVEANDGSGWHQVFSGTMIEAQPDYRGMPDVFFHIQARVGYYAQINPVPPSSYQGATDVATIIQTLASNMGFNFENNGVTAQLHNPYLAGTYFDQLQSVCQAANVDYYFVQASGPQYTLAITPANQPRQNTPMVVIGPQSGLIGYPVFQRFGIQVNCLFNFAITSGAPITVQSALPGANGQWNPYAMTHTLESLVQGGQWMSSLQCLAAA